MSLLVKAPPTAGCKGSTLGDEVSLYSKVEVACVDVGELSLGLATFLPMILPA